MVEWDAARYHRISDPQMAWGRRVMARIAPQPGERILDIGCGTGRLTEEMVAARPALVVGLDLSGPMLAEASARQTANDETGRAAVQYVRGAGEALPFAGAFDAVFSNATLHWVPDHERLFGSIHAALRPGGRLVAQCGGVGNLARLYGRARVLREDRRFMRFYEGWRDPWRFEGVDATRARLDGAGFVECVVWLEEAPTPFDGAAAFSEFAGAVCLRHDLARLTAPMQAAWLAEITAMAAADDPPFTLDYCRLNIAARKRIS